MRYHFTVPKVAEKQLTNGREVQSLVSTHIQMQFTPRNRMMACQTTPAQAFAPTW